MIRQANHSPEATDDAQASPQPLAMRPREAAAALGISPRLLWSLTAPRGSIRCIRPRGPRGSVIYATKDLEAWLDAEATRE